MQLRGITLKHFLFRHFNTISSLNLKNIQKETIEQFVIKLEMRVNFAWIASEILPSFAKIKSDSSNG